MNKFNLPSKSLVDIVMETSKMANDTKANSDIKTKEQNHDNVIPENLAKHVKEISEFADKREREYIHIEYSKKSDDLDSYIRSERTKDIINALESLRRHYQQAEFYENFTWKVEVKEGVLFQADLGLGYGSEPVYKNDLIAIMPSGINKADVTCVPCRFVKEGEELRRKHNGEVYLGVCQSNSKVHIFANVHYIRSINKIRMYKTAVGPRKYLFKAGESLSLTNDQLTTLINAFFMYIKTYRTPSSEIY